MSLAKSLEGQAHRGQCGRPEGAEADRLRHKALTDKRDCRGGR